MESSFTIYFESPFWVGVLERHDEDGYWIGKYVFGGEPSNAEVWEFAKSDFSWMRISLVHVTDQNTTQLTVSKRKSIKKAQRDARKEQARSFSTYTHEAMQQQLSMIKSERVIELKARKEQDEQKLFLMKQQKKKEKDRGH